MTGTTDQLYNLMDQIEASVWDNIKLTHINAKLLEYAKKQAIEIKELRETEPSESSVTDYMQSIIMELNKKISELTELVNNERSNQLDGVR